MARTLRLFLASVVSVVALLPSAGRKCAPSGALRYRSASASAERKKLVRFLYSDTGGGHRASALALRDALEASFPGQIECDLVDMFVESGQFPYCEYPAIYKKLADNPWSWQLLFELSSLPIGQWFADVWQEIACYDAFIRLLGATPRPDAVVSVHPLLQTVPLKALGALDGGERTTPFMTVTTDLGGAHPSWFHPDVDKCFVPSDALERLARRKGLGDQQIVQLGLPIRRGFWAGGSELAAAHDESSDASNKDRVRSALHLETSRNTVLVVGGGDGMGGLVATATAIADRLSCDGAQRTQLIIVCGRNDKARAALEARAAEWAPTVSVAVLGFVDNMQDYMAAADVLVTKAGPGTIAEACAMGLPCIISSFLPGQEAGNVDYVRDLGFGDYRGEPDQIADLVASYLGDDETLERMAEAARRAARPEATVEIAAEIARMVGVD